MDPHNSGKRHASALPDPLTRRRFLGSAALSGGFFLSRRLAAQPHREAEQSELHDDLRPRFHYLPAKGWMNDPCAPIFWRGVFHLFHQYNPNAAVWGDMHWYHATSPDLVHWTRRGIALAPIPGSADADGCFTGSAIVHQGRPAILYTGVAAVPHAQATLSDGTHNFRETQILATAADDRLSSWNRVAHNPVIPAPPAGMLVTGFRDPAPFQIAGQPDRWYTLVGSGIRRVGGNVLLYTTTDLVRWEYLHPLAQGTWSGDAGTGNDPVDTGEMWECPDFFPLDREGRASGETWVLIHSTQRKTLWQTGRLDPKTLLFHAERTGELDYGRDNVSATSKGSGTFYAPKSQLDQEGRRILWGWLPETRPEAAYSKAGWSGMMSLPRTLTLGPAGELLMAPSARLQKLRRPLPPELAAELNQTHRVILRAPVQEFVALLTVKDHPLPTSAEPDFLLADPGGPLLAVSVDHAQSPLALRINGMDITLQKPLSPEARLHVFFDNSVVELFLDDRLAFTHRFYQRDAKVPIVALTLSQSRTVRPSGVFGITPIWPA